MQVEEMELCGSQYQKKQADEEEEVWFSQNKLDAHLKMAVWWLDGLLDWIGRAIREEKEEDLETKMAQKKLERQLEAGMDEAHRLDL